MTMSPTQQVMEYLLQGSNRQQETELHSAYRSSATFKHAVDTLVRMLPAMVHGLLGPALAADIENRILERLEQAQDEWTFDAILPALLIVLAAADHPLSTTHLSIAVTAMLRKEGFKVADEGITGATVSTLLSSHLAALNDVDCVGTQTTVGRRKEKHWALHSRRVEWRKAAEKDAQAKQATYARVRVEVGQDDVVVVLDDRRAATFNIRVHVGWYAGEPTYIEVTPEAIATAAANQLAADIRRHLNNTNT